MANLTSCSPGVYDCEYPDIPGDAGECAQYSSDFLMPDKLFSLVIIAGVVMCLMAFGIGANDAANAWASSVGSGAISLRTAVIMGGIAEWLGAVTLGYGVSSKIQKGVSDVTEEYCWACGFCNSKMSVYTAGMSGALFGAAIFLLLATFTAMPVSTTHAIVGAVVGVTIAAVGGSCLNWDIEGGLGGIVLSWATSPILSGIIGVVVFITTKKCIMDSQHPRRNALRALPVLYAGASFVLLYLIMIKAQQTKDLEEHVQVAVAAVFSGAVLLGVLVFLVPYVKKNLPSVTGPNKRTTEHKKAPLRDGPSSSKDIDQHKVEVGSAIIPIQQDTEIEDAFFCFKHLLVFVAVLESFAHGANDTANATAAFSAVWTTYDQGLYGCEQEETPWWIMAIAGGFVMLGIVTIGYRVIETVGKNVVMVDFQRGFCIEFASMATVVVATSLELPVSTTHCQIGAVVFVGAVAAGIDGVSWKLFLQIVISWVLTLPMSGLVATCFMMLQKLAIRPS